MRAFSTASELAKWLADIHDYIACDHTIKPNPGANFLLWQFGYTILPGFIDYKDVNKQRGIVLAAFKELMEENEDILLSMLCISHLYLESGRDYASNPEAYKSIKDRAGLLQDIYGLGVELIETHSDIERDKADVSSNANADCHLNCNSIA